MPIKPENKHLYPHDWNDIRAKILERAHDRCEFCAAPNYAAPNYRVIYRDENIRASWAAWSHGSDGIPIKVVLTIAHLDHDPTNNHPLNLRACCQRCHNIIDMYHRHHKDDTQCRLTL